MRATFLSILLLAAPLTGCLGGDDDGDTVELKNRAEVTSELGGVQGVVTDDAFQPVVGANVTLIELNSTTRTASDGSYAFSNLRPGAYSISVAAQGFVSALQTVGVAADRAAGLDFVLVHLFTAEPFETVWELTGFFECGFALGYNLSALPPPANVTGGIITIAVCAFLNAQLEGVGGNATNDRFSHNIQASAPIHTLIVETTWDPAVGAVDERLWVDVVPEAHPCGSIVTCEWTFLDHWGPSPLVGRVDLDRFEHVQAYYDEQCEDGNDDWCGYSYFDDGWPLLLRVFPRWECTDAGPQGCVLVQQEFTHIVTGFFNAPAPAGYTALRA